LKRSNRKPKVTKRLIDRWTAYFLILHEGRCVVCGSTTNLTVGHFIGRGRWSVHYHPLNIHAQCAGCNIYSKWTSNVPYVRAMERLYRTGVVDSLEALGRKTFPDIAVYLDWIAEFWFTSLELHVPTLRDPAKGSLAKKMLSGTATNAEVMALRLGRPAYPPLGVGDSFDEVLDAWEASVPTLPRLLESL